MFCRILQIVSAKYISFIYHLLLHVLCVAAPLNVKQPTNTNRSAISYHLLLASDLDGNRLFNYCPSSKWIAYGWTSAKFIIILQALIFSAALKLSRFKLFPTQQLFCTASSNSLPWPFATAAHVIQQKIQSCNSCETVHCPTFFDTEHRSTLLFSFCRRIQ